MKPIRFGKLSPEWKPREEEDDGSSGPWMRGEGPTLAQLARAKALRVKHHHEENPYTDVDRHRGDE